MKVKVAQILSACHKKIVVKVFSGKPLQDFPLLSSVERCLLPLIVLNAWATAPQTRRIFNLKENSLNKKMHYTVSSLNQRSYSYILTYCKFYIILWTGDLNETDTKILEKAPSPSSIFC